MAVYTIFIFFINDKELELKKEIISMDAESDSESETSESESDSDDKPKLVAKKGKKIVPVKTTNGGKGLNLKKPDSDSESVEDSD